MANKKKAEPKAEKPKIELKRFKLKDALLCFLL